MFHAFNDAYQDVVSLHAVSCRLLGNDGLKFLISTAYRMSLKYLACHGPFLLSLLPFKASIFSSLVITN